MSWSWFVALAPTSLSAALFPLLPRQDTILYFILIYALVAEYASRGELFELPTCFGICYDLVTLQLLALHTLVVFRWKNG